MLSVPEKGSEDGEKTEDRVGRAPSEFILILLYPKEKGGGKRPTAFPAFKKKTSIITSLILQIASNHALSQTFCF